MKIRFYLEDASFLEENTDKTDLINLVLGNLIENALDELAGVPEGAVSILIEQRRDVLKLKVSDNGRGIDDREKAFEKGYSSKGPERGLGLYLIKKSVIRDGGVIGVESKPGHTVFTVKVPLERRSDP